MLVLSRKTQEAIIIADDIKITVLDVSGKQVRIGIEAPRDVSVHREEIYQKIEADKQTTNTAADDSEGGTTVDESGSIKKLSDNDA